MADQALDKGSFTLPGEAGYEALSLSLAEKWGADVIRDSDGTKLSSQLMDAGYRIYATLCIIRDHNEWAKLHPYTQQQAFLISRPVVAQGGTVQIPLLDGYFADQFFIDSRPEAMDYWQVYDRTSGAEVPKQNWHYDPASQSVVLQNAIPWRRYTASFLAFRVWEEINMYNHLTNHWTSEHLKQLDPRHPQVREYLLSWLDDWLAARPKVDVVRFTSLFYNFAFIWGESLRNRYLFNDWASYDFTVSLPALQEFEKQFGYALCAEDFVNRGHFQATHMPPTAQKRAWMDFTQDFVAGFAKELVDAVHRHGKKAYVFYDDSWVGMEPYGPKFGEIGFDGLIKCVFSGYEARLCAGVSVPVHELRLHPYLFPVGLGGAPTFMKGGDPAADARRYWMNVRRAILRAPVDRLGLGGYLHLTEGFPAFCDYIEGLNKEFRRIKALHEGGRPYTLPVQAAVLHCWGKLRSWSLSGHFHETDRHDLIHINEALSGLPVDVKFISFEDIKNGALNGVDVVINAGLSGSAWSGGDAWADADVVGKLTEWVSAGGTFIGVNEPSAHPGGDTVLRMAHVLGVDLDTGARCCHGRWKYDVVPEGSLGVQGVHFKAKENLYLTDGKAQVLKEVNGAPVFTLNRFGKGKGIYLSSFEVCPESARMLLSILLFAKDLSPEKQMYLTDSAFTECAYYPASNALAVINAGEDARTAKILTPRGRLTLDVPPYGCVIREV